MRAFLTLSKALADEPRLRLLLALRGHELCVCQLTEFLALAPSTVSKHLSILHQAGLVNSRKNGRWMYYSLPGREAAASVRKALDWVWESLKDSPETVTDNLRLESILKIDPVDLCKQQCKS